MSGAHHGTNESPEANLRAVIINIFQLPQRIAPAPFFKATATIYNLVLNRTYQQVIRDLTFTFHPLSPRNSIDDGRSLALQAAALPPIHRMSTVKFISR